MNHSRDDSSKEQNDDSLLNGECVMIKKPKSENIEHKDGEKLGISLYLCDEIKPFKGEIKSKCVFSI